MQLTRDLHTTELQQRTLACLRLATSWETPVRDVLYHLVATLGLAPCHCQPIDESEP